MSIINDIKRDRKTGTPGPWRYDCDWNSVWDGDRDIEIVAPNGCRFESDARRITRVPELEAALLEAVEVLMKITDADSRSVCQALARSLLSRMEGKSDD